MFKHFIILAVMLSSFSCGEDRPSFGGPSSLLLSDAGPGPSATTEGSGPGSINEANPADVGDVAAAADEEGAAFLILPEAVIFDPALLGVVLSINGIVPAFELNPEDEDSDNDNGGGGAGVKLWAVDRGPIMAVPKEDNAFVPRLNRDVLMGALPDPAMGLGSPQTPWLIGFETTGGLLRYIDPDSSEFSVEYGKEVEYNGTLVKCSSYITGSAEGDPLNGDEPGQLSFGWCRQKVTQDLYWDYFSLEMDHFAFWSKCLGHVVVDGFVRPVKKGIVTYDDKMGTLHSLFEFSGELTYALKNGNATAFSVKFSKLLREFSGELQTGGVEGSELYGAIAIGGKNTMLKNPYPVKDENDVYTNVEMKAPSEVIECFGE